MNLNAMHCLVKCLLHASANTDTITRTTAQSCPVLEEHVLPVSKNPYHEEKSQQDKKEKKASEQPVSKKPKLSRAQEEAKKIKSAKSPYKMNTDKKKKIIESNRSVLPHLGIKTPVRLPVAERTGTVPVITPTKNTHTKNDFVMILQRVLRKCQIIL